MRGLHLLLGIVFGGIGAAAAAVSNGGACKAKTSKAPVPVYSASVHPISYVSPPSVLPPASKSSHAPSSHAASMSARPSGYCENTPTDRQCWGEYDINTDYNNFTPDTGRTVTYYFQIDNVTIAPDGVPRRAVVVNGQYPGPTIEANWGDTVVIHVQNNLQNNGTTIHWHGVHQEHNNANDGVPGVTQCPIAPGKSFTYTFRATSYGHTWYHSHFSLQYPDGIVGPILINGPTSANWDIDLGPLSITDWFHTPASELFFTEELPGPPIAGDTGLVNGKNMFNGSGEYFNLKFTPGKKHRIRLINTSTNTHFKFWVDQHPMTVMAADFIPIVPYQTDVLNIAIGQRYDLVIDAAETPGNYWLHCLPATGCSSNNNQNGILAVVTYDGVTEAIPTSTPYTPSNTNCEDETNLVPVVKRDISSLAYGSTDTIALPSAPLVRWTINGSSFFANFENPSLLLIDEHNSSFPTNYNVIELDGDDTTWVYFVIESAGQFAVNHPIHVHGHDFLLIASGNGTFDESVIANADLTNPPRRDVATLPAPGFGGPVGGYLVLAILLDNPGVWLLHCHIAWHQAEGLVMQFIERSSDIPGNVGVTQQWYDTCTDWDNYQNKYHPPQDDSGV